MGTDTDCLVRLNGEEKENVKSFRYAGSVVNEDWSFEDEVNERV